MAPAPPHPLAPPPRPHKSRAPPWPSFPLLPAKAEKRAPPPPKPSSQRGWQYTPCPPKIGRPSPPARRRRATLRRGGWQRVRRWRRPPAVVAAADVSAEWQRRLRRGRCRPSGGGRTALLERLPSSRMPPRPLALARPLRTHSTGPFPHRAPQQDVEASCRLEGGSPSTAHATRSDEGSRHPRASAKKSSRNPPEAALRKGQLAGRTSREQHSGTRVVPIFWTGAPGICTNQSDSTVRLYPKSNAHMIQIKY
ncbi:hypothetical protein BU14_0154s0015 [Porphyra umbilicalis]|uniref:Uncharacterized protein n=1 Tax=Porphyra umbilicalis TaxID=2786 RepID=A0A1X6P8L5_PORUM|nr:hypothetical protein BU14_0154s0015 [Porphyra umbilicalis]|eukprot:OSX77239.1 hypothetical protein BU14_0154s0015 [Porphyra umbilicalis]